MLNQYNRHFAGDADDYDSNISTIRHNLHSSWVVDSDPFRTNQLGHPYLGSMYHGFARSAGLNYWEALGYTFAGSALWEIAGERTPPSRNDQINTGIGGTFLGEALFRMAHVVLAHDEIPPLWRELGAAADLAGDGVQSPRLRRSLRRRVRQSRPGALQQVAGRLFRHRREQRGASRRPI